jgi:serine/threonine protein kinase
MLSAVGMVLGTAAYMSPEQARGYPADKRADIWAFGVVLFEMLSGRRLFTGDTISDTLASVLKTEPDWGLLPSTVTTRLRALLRWCLEKARNAGCATSAMHACRSKIFWPAPPRTLPRSWLRRLRRGGNASSPGPPPVCSQRRWLRCSCFGHRGGKCPHFRRFE